MLTRLSPVLSAGRPQLPVREFSWARDAFPALGFDAAPGRRLGLVAQQLEAVAPALVRTDAGGGKSVALDVLAALLVAAGQAAERGAGEIRAALRSAADADAVAAAERAALREVGGGESGV